MKNPLRSDVGAPQGLRTIFKSLGTVALAGAFLGSASQASAQTAAPAPASQPVYIILKLDDLTKVTPRWQKTVDFLQSKNVKSAIGIIANSLEGDKPDYFDWIKKVQATGLVEFWHHGYDHRQWEENGEKRWEFGGPSYDQQKDHFTKSQRLAKEKLGMPFHTFGAPFNKIDETTAKVLAEDPDLKIVLYGNTSWAPLLKNVLILDRSQMNIEVPLFVPNSKQVQHDFEILSKRRNCFVIQGHPDQWDEARFVEFEKMMDYLISKGVTFTTPYEYFLTNPDPKATWQASASAPSTEVANPAASAAEKPTPPPNSGNLLFNPDFEKGLERWSIFIGEPGQEENCTINVAERKGRNGTTAGQLSSTAPARYSMLQYLRGYSFEAKQRYRISAWVKAGDDFVPVQGTPAFLLRSTMFTVNGEGTGVLVYVGTDDKAVTGPDTRVFNNQKVPKKWTKIEAVFEMAPNTEQMNACIFVWKGSGSFLVDDFVLERVADNTPLTRLSN